jgi:hypothetical protein
MLPTLAALPEDVHHALEIRWEARLAFELLSADSAKTASGGSRNHRPSRPEIGV